MCRSRRGRLHVKARAECLRFHCVPPQLGIWEMKEGLGVNSASHIYIMVVDIRYHRVKTF